MVQEELAVEGSSQQRLETVTEGWERALGRQGRGILFLILI